MIKDLVEDVTMVSFSDEDAAKRYAAANKGDNPKKNEKTGEWDVIVRKVGA